MPKKLSIEYSNTDLIKQTFKDFLKLTIYAIAIIAILYATGKVYVIKEYSQSSNLKSYKIDNIEEINNHRSLSLMGVDRLGGVRYNTDYTEFKTGDYILMYTDNKGNPIITFNEVIDKLLQNKLTGYIIYLMLSVLASNIAIVVIYYNIRAKIQNIILMECDSSHVQK